MHLPAQDSELMPKHDDLQLLELIRTPAQKHELQQAAQSQVAKRPEQEKGSSESAERGRPTLRAYI
jgi:hypothetical protein